MSLNRKISTLKRRITRIENFIQSFTECAEKELVTPLKVKLDQMECVKNDIAKLLEKYTLTDEYLRSLRRFKR